MQCACITALLDLTAGGLTFRIIVHLDLLEMSPDRHGRVESRDFTWSYGVIDGERMKRESHDPPPLEPRSGRRHDDNDDERHGRHKEKRHHWGTCLFCSLSCATERELGRESGRSPIMATMASLWRLANGAGRTASMVVMVRSRRHTARLVSSERRTCSPPPSRSTPIIHIKTASSAGSATRATEPLPAKEGVGEGADSDGHGLHFRRTPRRSLTGN